MASPKIVLYTNHSCPWAHRAHIALKALDLPYEEHIIDLSVPRTPEYLAINPRGQVPALVYDGEIITESAIVAQFLADSYPDRLEKTSVEPGGALLRARVNFFVDAFISKVVPHTYGGYRAVGEDKDEFGAKLVDAVVKDVEPLLQDAAPFFGGSSTVGLAEVQTGSFVLRILDSPQYGLLATSMLTNLEAKAPSFWKWAKAVVKEESVNYIWDAKTVSEKTKAKWATPK